MTSPPLRLALRFHRRGVGFRLCSGPTSRNSSPSSPAAAPSASRARPSPTTRAASSTGTRRPRRRGWRASRTRVYHEGPGQVLSGLLTRIAAIRGAPILTLGAADLLLRNARGERQRILQADQVVLSGSGGDAAPWRRRRGGHGSPAGRRSGGRLRHRRAAGQAGAVRGMGLPRGMGGGAGGRVAAPAPGPDHPPPVGRKATGRWTASVTPCRVGPRRRSTRR